MKPPVVVIHLSWVTLWNPIVSFNSGLAKWGCQGSVQMPGSCAGLNEEEPPLTQSYQDQLTMKVCIIQNLGYSIDGLGSTGVPRPTTAHSSIRASSACAELDLHKWQANMQADVYTALLAVEPCVREYVSSCVHIHTGSSLVWLSSPLPHPPPRPPSCKSWGPLG